MKNDTMQQTCATMAAAFEHGLGYSSLRPAVDHVDSIHENGVTVEVRIDGQVYVAEFRHVDDEVV